MIIEALIAILIVAFVLFLIWYLVGKFMPGTPATIVGLILGLILLMYALTRLGITNTIKF